MKIIGVTGYSGTGKSTAAKLISEKIRNAQYVNCDEWMHMIPKQFRELMIEKYGEEQVGSGKNAGQLLELIFQDTEKGIEFFKEVMPWVNDQLLNRIDELQEAGVETVICDWALLPALDIWKQCNLRVKVDSPTKEDRYEMLLGRSFYNRSDVISSLPDEERLARYDAFKKRDDFVDGVNGTQLDADVVLENNYDREVLEQRVNKICESIYEKTRLTDLDVQDMLEGKKSNYLLREGLCGKDISEWDLSDLSTELFKKLCFDSKTEFSKEQIEKFHPKELLEMTKKPSEDILRLHSQGITGQGLKVAVIDTNIDGEHDIFSSGNINMKSGDSIGEVEQHGLTVVSALLNIIPDAQIDYYPYNKYDGNRDVLKEKIIDEIIKSGVKIISMSSSFDSEEIRKRILGRCEEAGVTLIDQPTFVQNFTYCFRNISERGEESFEEAFMEPEDAILSERAWKEGKKMYQMLLRKYSVTDQKSLKEIIEKDSSIDENEKKNMLDRLERFGQLLECEHYEGEGGVRNISKKQAIQEEKSRKTVDIEKKPVEMACGGMSFASPNGYKYFGTCSNSYTIPQIAGVFALTRQIFPDIDFKQFVQLTNETAMQIDDRLVIAPEALIEQVRQLGKTQENATELYTITKSDILTLAKKDSIVFEKENVMEIRKKAERGKEEETKKTDVPDL